MATQWESDTLTAPSIYTRSDYHAAGGPYIIGCHGGRNPVEDWTVWLLTVDVQQMRPIVEKIETKSAAINTKYRWEIKQMYGGDTLWHQDSGYGLALQHGQNGADTIVVLDQRKEYSMPLWITRGSATWETAYRPEDIYSISPKNIEGVSNLSMFCFERSDVIRLSFYEANTQETNYRKAKDHQQQWVIKSCGDTQWSLLGKVDQLEKDKAEAEGRHQQALRDLAAAEARTDGTVKERDDARMREAETRERLEEAEAELARLRAQLKEAEDAQEEQEKSCAADKADMKKNLDDAAQREKDSSRAITKLENELRDAKADAEEALNTQKQQKEKADEEAVAHQRELHDAKVKADRLESENAALKREQDASKTESDTQRQKIKDLRAQLGDAQTNADSAASKLADEEAACAREKERLKSKLDKALEDRDRLKKEKADAEDAQHAAETAKDQAEKEKAALQAEKDKLQETSDAATKADAEQRTKAKSDQEALESQLQDARKAQKAKDKEIENLKESLAEKEADEKAAREAQKAAEAARDAAVDESKKREKALVDGKNKDAQTIEALQAEKEDRTKKLADCRREGVKNGKELDRLTRERPELIRRAEEADEDAKKAREQLENAKKKRRDAEDQLADEKDRSADLQRDLDDAKKELEALRKKEEKRKSKKKDKNPKDAPDEKLSEERLVEGATEGIANGPIPDDAQKGIDTTDTAGPIDPSSNLPSVAEPGKAVTSSDSGAPGNAPPGSTKPSIEDQIKDLQNEIARQKKEIDDLKAGKKPDEPTTAMDNKPNPGRSDTNAPERGTRPADNPSDNAPNAGAPNHGPGDTQSKGQAPVTPSTPRAPQSSLSNRPQPADNGSATKPDIVPGSNNPGAQQPDDGEATAAKPQPSTPSPAQSGPSQPAVDVPPEDQTRPSIKPTNEPGQPASKDEDLKKQLADMANQLKKMQEQLDQQQNSESSAGAKTPDSRHPPLPPKTDREDVVDKETKDILDSLMSPSETCTDRCPTCKRSFAD